jgi:hypothetical protein
MGRTACCVVGDAICCGYAGTGSGFGTNCARNMLPGGRPQHSEPTQRINQSVTVCVCVWWWTCRVRSAVMLPATTAMRTHMQSPPSPRRTHAQSHGGGLTQRTVRMRRMSPLNACARVARSATETAAIQCEEGRTFSASSAAFFSATAFLACQTRPNAELQSPARANSPPRFRGSEKVKKLSRL